MPHDIFDDVARPPAGLGSQAWYTVPLSILVHAAAVAILVIVPLMATDVLPSPSSVLTVVAAPPMPEPPPIPVAPRPTAPTATATAPANRDAAPITPPETIADEVPGPPSPPGVTIGHADPGAFGAGAPGAVSGVLGIPDPPPPVVPQPVRPGGNVRYPAKVRDVRPVYPAIAISARVEGRVMIEAIIGVDGRVKDARILKSIPLLDRAALDAVQQWLFSPTLLNGVPVPVIITITVDFKLH